MQLPCSGRVHRCENWPNSHSYQDLTGLWAIWILNALKITSEILQISDFRNKFSIVCGPIPNLGVASTSWVLCVRFADTERAAKTPQYPCTCEYSVACLRVVHSAHAPSCHVVTSRVVSTHSNWAVDLGRKVAVVMVETACGCRSHVTISRDCLTWLIPHVLESQLSLMSPLGVFLSARSSTGRALIVITISLYVCIYVRMFVHMLGNWHKTARFLGDSLLVTARNSDKDIFSPVMSVTTLKACLNNNQEGEVKALLWDWKWHMWATWLATIFHFVMSNNWPQSIQVHDVGIWQVCFSIFCGVVLIKWKSLALCTICQHSNAHLILWVSLQ